MKVGDKLRKIERAISRTPKAKRQPIPLSSGSTLLNLACSGDARGAFFPGNYYLLVGDSGAAKTLLALTCFAEALLSPRYQDYELIHDNVENGCLIDLRRMFNQEVYSRVRAPATDEDGAPRSSETVEDFYFNAADLLDKGKPFIYVLDSMDALTSKAAASLFDENRKAHRRGGDAKGSYGDGKAKINSTELRRIVGRIQKSGSILIIIAQTRDNLGFGFGSKKTRSGGNALRFYAHVEIWTSILKTIKRHVQGRDRAVGVNIGMTIKKNRQTGIISSVSTPVYPSVGIDDLGGCVDYLIEEAYWKKKAGRINAKELGIVADRELLIQAIERKEGAVDALKATVQKCWDDIRDASAIKRQNRYAQK